MWNAERIREKAVSVDLKMNHDAARWKKLIRLCGTPQDGLHTSVRLFWDDATMTPFILVGQKSYYSDRGSFEAVIDSIEENETNV